MNVTKQKLKTTFWIRSTVIILPDKNNIYKVEFINIKED